MINAFSQIKRKLFLLNKAFFSFFWKFHYSQFGEDIVLAELLKKEILNGFFVDIGCYHPKKHSNTYKLYKKGWRGINVDMEEDKISLFNIIRPGDYNVLSAVSDKQEYVTLHRYSNYGVGSTIDPSCAAKTTEKVYDQQQVLTKTLNEIIEESPYKDKQIDILSIDVEGMDFRVLNSLDIELYKPKIIIIEDHNTNIEAILKTNIWNLLNNKGYVLRSWTFYSLIFILPNADILKKREHLSRIEDI
jgi:FkbM family methyltransferase